MPPALPAGSVPARWDRRHISLGRNFKPTTRCKPRVLGLVNDAHPSAAQLFENAVVRDGLPDEWMGVRHLALILGCGRRQVNEADTLAYFLREAHED